MGFIRFGVLIVFVWRNRWIHLIYGNRGIGPEFGVSNPKVRNFVWRVCHGVLPTRVRPQDKGVQCPTNCVSCADVHEDLAHVFFDCPFVMRVWRSSGLWEAVHHIVMNNDSAVGTVFSLLQNLSPDLSQRFAANLWSVWKHRNIKLWRNEDELCAQVVERAHILIQDWRAANLSRNPETQQQQSSEGSVAFQPPHIAEARSSTAVTAARQAENVASNSVQQQHMTGSCPRNSQPLNLGHVRPVSVDTAGGQIAFQPHNMERQQQRQAANIMYGQPVHISQVPSSSAGTTDPNQWHKPQQGRYKCNVDASFSSIRKRTGIGICLRDDEGAFVLAKTMSLSPMSSVHVGEALGLLYAMQDMHFDNVDFVLNSKITTDAFHTRRIYVTEFGHVITACRHLFSTFTNSRVEFNR